VTGSETPTGASSSVDPSVAPPATTPDPSG
jgi:hypothetical protein